MESKMRIGSLSTRRVQSSLRYAVLLSALLLAVPFLTSCGGGSAAVSPPPPPPAVAITISPSTVTLPAAGTQTFTAIVQGTTNTAVTWTVQEGAVGGAITNLGVYTAPTTLGTYHVIATSQADSTKSAVGIVTVVPVTVSIVPAADTLGPAGVLAFTAFVIGLDHTVTWAIQEGAAGGTITSTGPYTALYTAPTQLGIYHVIATSVADSSKSATATITVVQSGFRPTGAMNGGHVAHTATLLSNGTVMIVGCADDPDGLCHFGGDLAELYDPAPGTFSISGRMGTPRAFHTATLLPSGQVLVVGGTNSTVAELYDPATGAFTPTGSMASARSSHTATLLPNGKVLVVGGTNSTVAELYDPATGTFTPTGSMASARSRHTATLLPNGQVLVVGGTNSTVAELYDPATGTFTPTGSMGSARSSHTATLLPNGTVLVAGGNGSGFSAELYDPATGSFMPTGSMASARYFHTATLLLNGTVLVAGGFGDGVLATAELYDPATGSFMPTGSMASARGEHTATLLLNGRVLITGGWDLGFPNLSSAELYE